MPLPTPAFSDRPHRIPRKKWHQYLPLCCEFARLAPRVRSCASPTVVILMLIAPQPSFIIIIVNYHIRTLHEPLLAFTHVVVFYTLTFLTSSSLLVCVTRDPGSIKGSDHSYDAAGSDEELSHLVIAEGGDEEEAEMSLAEVLESGREAGRKPRWCKKCMVRSSAFVHGRL